MPKTVNDSINQALSISVAAMKEPIKTYDCAIVKQLQLIPNTLTSIKSISAGIISEIGDVNRFYTYAALAKYANLAWNAHKSGNFEAEITNLVKSGNRYL